MNQENFLLWLKRTEIPLSRISKKTGAISYNKIEWMSLKIMSKVKFLTD